MPCIFGSDFSSLCMFAVLYDDFFLYTDDFRWARLVDFCSVFCALNTEVGCTVCFVPRYYVSAIAVTVINFLKLACID